MRILLPLLGLMLLSYNVKCEASPDSLLGVLKSEMCKKRFYDSQKDRRVRLFKQQQRAISKTNLAARYALCNDLYEEYKNYVFDSAHVYALRLNQISKLMHDLPKQYESQIYLGEIQLNYGMFKETFDCVNHIDPNKLPDSVKVKYYKLKSRAYTDLVYYNRRNEFYSAPNRTQSLKALDSAILLAKPESYEKYKGLAERFTVTGKKAKAFICYRKLLQDNSLSYHERAMIANDLSNIIDDPERTRLITLAAIYDIRSSTKATLAAFTLGKIAFSQGNIKDAELLLHEALNQAQFYGGKLHEAEISAFLNTVNAQDLINTENEKNQALTYLIVILIIAIAGTAIISFIVYIRLKRVRLRESIVREQNLHLDKINKKLSEDARIKEEYIGYFFNVISGYILQLEKIKRNTERKIKLKQYEELLQLANEIDIKQERDSLFYTFDHIFLKLFPNFITAFNSLLKPEDQIWPKANEVLNTNLRIFALMRLGIKDNQTIANILENSVSTIYTYKIRIKSKALVQSNDFDNRIMEIKFVDI